MVTTTNRGRDGNSGRYIRPPYEVYESPFLLRK
jgi:hypothetical protein